MESHVRKPIWDATEAVIWICTRNDHFLDLVSTIPDERRLALALFGARRPLNPRSLLLYRQAYPEDAHETADPPTCPAIPAHAFGLDMWPDEAWEELIRKTSGGTVKMTAMRYGVSSNRTLIPRTELNGLKFCVRSDTGAPLVGLYDRSSDVLVWHSPEFLSATVVRAWPARSVKTLNVSNAILDHLHQIMRTDPPLTKPDARGLCLAAVKDAYPAAFDKAWVKLDPSLKRGRGKHGPRAH